MKQLALVLIIPLIISTVIVIPGNANSATLGCLDSKALRKAKQGSPYMLFDSERPMDGVINIREKPSSTSNLVLAAQSGNRADVIEQVASKDGFCWLNVQVTYKIVRGKAFVVTGWVRGDLLSMLVE
jgi:hypothetical protein